MTRRGWGIAAIVIAAALAAAVAGAQPCDDSGQPCVPGGGPAASDCVLEWRLRPVPPLRGNGLPDRRVVCYEGDPRCDSDADLDDGRCVLALAPCINSVDGRLPACAPTDVATIEVQKPNPLSPRDAADTANVAAIEQAAHAAFGVTVLRRSGVVFAGTANPAPDLCAAPLPVAVPLRARRAGTWTKGRKTLRVAAARTLGGLDADTLKLECRPSTCGNGQIEAHEACDDGNRANGDGCDQGCQPEAPTPTPTATALPPTATATASVTATATATASPTASGTATDTATASPTPTATPPATASSTATATATATATFTATPTVTASATATRTSTATATATITPSATPTATATPPSFSVALTAWRPQTAPFQRRAVPAGELLVPGVGVRLNGDDDNGNAIADVLDDGVAGEDDLIELTVQVDPPTAPAGYEYVLTRADAALRVWDSSTKDVALLDGNDELPIAVPGGTRTVWVERLAAGDTLLTLAARPVGGGGALASAPARFFAFSSIVIALGGENQGPSDPASSNHGIFVIAVGLHEQGYDVHMYDEDQVSSSGAGAVYDEVVDAVQTRGVGTVAIYGYSHGGGSTHDLANRLNTNRAGIGTFAIPYTGYIDAIRNSSDIDINAETRLPPSSAYHVNYYQRNDTFLRGNSVAGADVNVNANSQPWGGSLVHTSVDDHPTVRDGLLQPLLARVGR